MADSKKSGEFFTYKGRPLVRCGDEIYYGNMEEPYVIRLQIKSKKVVNGEELADKVTVQLMATDPYLSPRKQLVKSSEKNGLFLRWILPTYGWNALCPARKRHSADKWILQL